MIVIAPDYIATTFNTYYHGPGAQVAFPWTMRRLEEIDCVGWNDRWNRAAEAVPATLSEIERQLGPDGQIWLVASLAEFPDEEAYYGQIRSLKAQLDVRYRLDQSLTGFRNGAETADVFVYSRREENRADE